LVEARPEVPSPGVSVTVGALPYQPFRRSGERGATEAVVVGAVASRLIVSEIGPEVPAFALVAVTVELTSQDGVNVPSVVNDWWPEVSPQPVRVAVIVAAGVGKPDQSTSTFDVYQPFCPLGATGVTFAQGKPWPLSPGPVSIGRFSVLAPPLGYDVFHHCA
jgi:hypothetical protein